MKSSAKILLILFVSLLFRAEAYSQSGNGSLDPKTIYLSAGVGYKYHLIPIDPYPYSFEKAYKDRFAFNIGVEAALWGGQKHFIGIDLLGFPYKYGDKSMSPRFFTLIANAFYKRNIPLSNNLSLYPAAGISFFSNGPVHMGTVNLDIGGNYDLGSYQLYIRNGFRFSAPFILDNPPSFLTVGCAIKY